ncbi:MAG: hypothetical protein ABII90_13670 [Bacteroidota bacterium]
MVQLNFQTDFTLVTAILPKHSVNRIIENAIPEQLVTAVEISARGSLVSDKWIQKFLPSVNPEQVVIELIVPDEYADTVMDNFIIAGKLHLSGGGAVYSIKCDKMLFIKPFNKDITINRISKQDEDFNYKKGLTGIFCIAQKDKSDHIARSAMKDGAPGPTVVFGQGRGIRDKLGLLRIAISPEKELIRVVVDNYDTEPVFESMVTEGKLDTPGMGFIYIMPIQKGLINIASVFGSKDQLATNHQIIKAIDDIRGGTAWRAHGAIDAESKDGSKDSKGRKFLSDLIRLSCVTERGKGDWLVEAAMNAGAPGASIAYGRKIGGEEQLGKTDIKLSKEVEIIELTLSPNKVDEIIAEMVEAADEDGNEDVYFYTQPVPKALTYLG